jgi:hypothetical protein
VYQAFDPSILNAKRMAAAKAARDVLTPLVESEVRAINKLIGNGICLEPIDVRFRLKRLISQMHLQKLAVSKEMAGKIRDIEAKVVGKASPAANAVDKVAKPAADCLEMRSADFPGSVMFIWWTA